MVCLRFRTLVCHCGAWPVKIKIDTSALKQSHWYQYLVRFFFGGAVTALAGVIANRFGPAVGGLFLAFPAIFPAAATLINDLEKEKKERVGANGTRRGRTAAGMDAIGSSLGSIGLLAFALVVWQRLPKSNLTTVLASATLAWFVISVSLWELRELLRRRARKNTRRRSNRRLLASVHDGPRGIGG
jgi:Protein of unknown function (DUF3147)